MQRATALEQANYLLLMPAAVRQFRLAPLPEDVRLVLRVLAGDEEARVAAVDLSGKPEDTIVRASEFYVREVLLASGTTDFRALGCEPDAPREELRANMILLMRWLHPDTANGPRDDELFEKVRQAWQTMRSDESRLAYRQALAPRISPAQTMPARAQDSTSALRSNPFLDRATGSRRRRLLKGSIYIAAAALMVMLVAFLLDHFGALSEFDLSMVSGHTFHTSSCETVRFPGLQGAFRVPA